MNISKPIDLPGEDVCWLTIAELAAAGVGAILVPFPFAVDDHQTANAHFLEQGGAALIRQQTELTAERLAALLREQLADPLARPERAGDHQVRLVGELGGRRQRCRRRLR